ncbi:hypothetical protein Micbo1qcDRAFT_237241 [Microdochium bolleyi]|uniref:Zn(2)-C6 fungal-type domain-containing protein n=1 Tax=Microdochium bolleyi TaxID=196109 RepID=A0A136ILZ4_9PEZI|nr:hypothetical protein Micbo1qcDRAFT_237241 [Microdochium bolleyi]
MDDEDDQTPDSSSHRDPSPHDPADPNDPNDPKKPRACEACRGLKVKCEPDPGNIDGPCKRCAKAGRSCVVTQPTRKRQKKTDSRVAELEKKIDALTATLQASRVPPGASASSSPYPASHHGGAPSVVNGGYASHHEPPGRARSVDRRTSAASSWASVPPRSTQQAFRRGLGIGDAILPSDVTSGSHSQKRKFSDEPSNRPASTGLPDHRLAPGPPQRPPRDPNQQVADVVDRGILSMDQATELFARYTDHMAQHLPIVIFPPDMTAQHVRKSTPHLFLAILAAAASELSQIQRILVKELTQLIADKVVVIGEKSMELVQAILVGVIWYFPPEHFEELKFYQFVHLAGVMAIDIGLGKRKANAKSRLIPYTWRDHPFRKSPLPDPTSIESRRTWLGCYFLAANVSMALHRPNLIRWSSFMQECLDVLTTSPDAAPTDKNLCHLVWTHRLAEEIGVQFSMDDPSIHVDVSEAKVQHALKGFERDIVRYRDSIPAEEKRPSLILAFHVVSLYMHEIALYVDKADEFRPPLNAEALRDPIPALSESLTSAHVSALSSCLTAIDGIFETFLAMDIPTIRCLPIFNFVRVAYAVVVLIKMYFSASAPGSELGRVFSKEDMKVQLYLDRLLEKFRETAASDKSRPAGKFLVVLMMLSGWFRKQEGGGAAARSDISTQPEDVQQQQQRQGPDGSGGDSRSLQPPSFARGNSSSSAPTPQRQAPQDYQQYHHQPQQHSSGQWQQQQQPQHQQEYPQASTPLHLLSEVATGGGAAEQIRLEHQQQQQQQQQQQHPDWTSYSAANSNNNNATPPGGNSNDAGGQSIPWLPGSSGLPPASGGGWGEVDYTAGLPLGGVGAGGLEQAMDMTLTGFGGIMMGGDGGGSSSMDHMQQQQQYQAMAMANQDQVISSILESLPMNPPDGWFQ